MTTFENAASHPVIWQCWRDSRRADRPTAPQACPIPKRDAVKFWHKARELECRTRAPGHQDGKLGRNGLKTLEALIFGFLNHKNGRLDPTKQQIADWAGMSVRSVARGLVKLRGAGILKWIKRCIADQDESGRFVLRQISNLYEIVTDALFSIIPAPDPESWGARPSDGNSLDRAVALATDGLAIGHVLRELENEEGLAGALARLGRTNFLKKTERPD